MNTFSQFKYSQKNKKPAYLQYELTEPSIPLTHEEKVTQQLKDVGMTKIALKSSESKYLPKIIHPDEKIGGVVYGKAKDGFVILVATDRRIIYLDKKPMFVNEDEVTYNVVSGVKYSQATVGLVVTLHTKVKDFSLRSINKSSAIKFVKYIESRCLENKSVKEI